MALVVDVLHLMTHGLDQSASSADVMQRFYAALLPHCNVDAAGVPAFLRFRELDQEFPRLLLSFIHGKTWQFTEIYDDGSHGQLLVCRTFGDAHPVDLLAAYLLTTLAGRPPLYRDIEFPSNDVCRTLLAARRNESLSLDVLRDTADAVKQRRRYLGRMSDVGTESLQGPVSGPVREGRDGRGCDEGGVGGGIAGQG